MRRILSVLIVAVVGLTWSVITADRAYLWGDARLIWSDAVAQAPLKPRPWINLGTVYANQGATEIAVAAYQEGARVAQLENARARYDRILGQAFAEVNLAILRFNQGDREEAVRLTTAILARHPTPIVVEQFYTWLVMQRSSSS